MSLDLTAFRAAVLDDPLVRDVWASKYRLPGETSVAETRARVVAAVYRGDPSADARAEAHELVRAGVLMPAGRVNAGAGSPSAVTLINCFVSETVQDSMPGIQRMIARAALTMQQGGGIGTDFSTLRPAGALVGRTGSVSSGAVAFMAQQDAMCRTIVSGGTRRGAMMATLRDDHPDLWNEEQLETRVDPHTGATVLKRPSFISAKRQPGALTQFNVSVLVSDAFLAAVRVDADWDLGFHVPRADGSHVAVYDRPFSYDPIELDNAFQAVSGGFEAPRRGAPRPWYVYTRVKARRLWEDLLRSAYIYAEPGVIFIDRVNERNNLRYCEEIRCCNPCVAGDTLIAVAGAEPVSIKVLAERGTDFPVYCTNPTTGEIAVRWARAPRLTRRQQSLVKVTFDDGSSIRVTPDHMFPLRDGQKVAAKDLQPWDSLRRFDRTKAGDGTIYIGLDKRKEFHLIGEAKIGRTLKLGRNRQDDCVHHEDEDHYNNSWDNISVITNEARARNHKVVGVSPDGVEDVYNVTVDEFHTYAVVTSHTDKHGRRCEKWSGVFTCNCGEQPLPPHGICCLASINLAFLVTDPFTGEAALDEVELARAVRVGVRFLDNVLDVTGYPLREQGEEARAKRRIGLGVTGWADALLQLGLTYGSPEAVDLTRWVAARLRDESYRASAALAAERGPFPRYDRAAFARGWTYRRLPLDVQSAIHESGLRNGVLNTVAPNGTVSVYVGNVSSGLEPVYAFEKTMRRVRQPDGTSKEYESVDYALRLYEAINGPMKRADLPPYFVGALDVVPSAHVKMQAAWQEYVDAAVSKTVNVPTATTFEEFRGIYHEAYAAGCKGCTVYRYDPAAGRGAVLAVAEPKEAGGESAPADKVRPRPRTLAGVTYKLKWPVGGPVNWYVTVTHDAAGVPRELFITTRNTDYQEWVQAVSCAVTAILRRGGDVRFLVEELQQVSAATGAAFVKLDDADKRPRRFSSVVAAIGAVLEREFAKTGVTVAAEVAAEVAAAVAPAGEPALPACPACGAPGLIREEGCERCPACGYTRCG